MENYLKQYYQNRVDKRKQEKEKEVADMFNIAIKDNKLWITHNGYAIKEIENASTASEIVEEIGRFRTTAKKFGTSLARTAY